MRAAARVKALAVAFGLALGLSFGTGVRAGAAAAATDEPLLLHSVLVAPDGLALDVEWHLPAGEARALITLQHGFARRCANLRGLARAFAQAGFATLCANAELARGAAPLAQALATALRAGWDGAHSAAAHSAAEHSAAALVPPDGRALPAPVLVAGHSAGGLFAAHLGAALAQTAPQRLAGALLFDPVGGDDLARALAALRGDAARPVLALLAPAARCNARQSARPALRAAAGDGAIFDVAGGTHLDAEGDDTEAVAVRACGEGWPRAEVVQALRAQALAWAATATATATAAAALPSRTPPAIRSPGSPPRLGAAP